jgi:hypothetical protein
MSITPLSLAFFRRLQPRTEANISGKTVRISKRIMFHKPLQQPDHHDLPIEIDPPDHFAGRRKQDFLFP